MTKAGDAGAPAAARVRPALRLGRKRDAASIGAAGATSPLELPPHHLVTHGAIVGMTGSGKTGLSVVLVEEALRSRVPVLLIDVKGDLPNLLLAFARLAPEEFEPWIDVDAAARDGKTAGASAAEVSALWREGLAGWDLGPTDAAELARTMAPRLITPGTTAGEPLHVLSSLEARSPLWEEDEEAAREAVSASVSLLLRLIERDADPARSREHVVLSLLAERRHRARLPAGLAELLGDLARPPVERVGALAMDEFLPPKERLALAQELNALLASPSFASWRQGTPLDVGAWLTPAPSTEGPPRTPVVIVSVAHLDDAERSLVLGLVLENVLSWVRGLPGTSELRALVLFDEVFGFLPPHPQNPPTKRPLLALLKQARAFGVGVVVATQNPMDLDYKALSNAGLWFVGRLQTDADRDRLVEGLVGSDGGAGGLDAAALATTLKSLPPRQFFVRNIHARPTTCLLETRWSLSWLRGPMTRRELSRLSKGIAPAPNGSIPAVVAGASPAAAPPAATPAAAPPVVGVPVPVPVPAPPLPPQGWAVFHGHVPASPPASWSYVPHVAITAIAHLRDTKLGIAVNRTMTLVAPIGPDGRPDTAQSHVVPRAYLAGAPIPGRSYLPLPGGLALKKGMQAAERAMREHCYRSLVAAVEVHAELGLWRGDAEPAEAFIARCTAEAQRRCAAMEQAIVERHLPKLAKAQQRILQAQTAVSQTQAATGGAPGAVGAVLAGAFGGTMGRRVHAEQSKVAARLQKAQAALVQAELALREAMVARDIEIATLRQSTARAHLGTETRSLTPKKGDIEVQEIGIAWAAG